MLASSRHGGQTQPHVSGYPPDGPTGEGPLNGGFAAVNTFPGVSISWTLQCARQHTRKEISTSRGASNSPRFWSSTHSRKFKVGHCGRVWVLKPGVLSVASYKGGRLLIVSVIAEGGGPFEKVPHICGNGRTKQVLFFVGFGSSSERETRADFECGVARCSSFVHSCCMRK
jgi:hypothetical protein